MLEEKQQWLYVSKWRSEGVRVYSLSLHLVRLESTDCPSNSQNRNLATPHRICHRKIRRTITDPSPNRLRMAMVYESFSWKEERKTTSNREDAVRLTRLQSGYTPLHAHLIYLAADPAFPLFMVEPQIVEQCAFGGPSSPLRALTANYEKMLVTSRVTF